MPRQRLDESDPTVVLSIKLPAHMRDRVRRRAKREGVPVALVVRDLLAAWLEEPPRPRFKGKS